MHKRRWGDLEDETPPHPSSSGGQRLQWGQTGARRHLARPALMPMPAGPSDSCEPERMAGGSGMPQPSTAALMARAVMRRSSGYARRSAAPAAVEDAEAAPSCCMRGSRGDDAAAVWRAQEEEDARLAQQVLAEEQERARRSHDRMQQRMSFLAHLEEMAQQESARTAQGELYSSGPLPAARRGRHAGASAAAAAAAQNSRRRTSAMPPAGGAEERAHYHAAHRGGMPVGPYGFGMSLASTLLGLPAYAFGGGSGAGGDLGGSGGGIAGMRRSGLPPQLMQMREMVAGLQRAGLPPSMLFSDRDFTADDYDMLCRLDETVESRKGASTAEIEALPIQTVPPGGLHGDSGEPLSCAVCLEELAEGAQLRALPCMHRFHRSCIDQWLGHKAACPVCQRECR